MLPGDKLLKECKLIEVKFNQYRNSDDGSQLRTEHRYYKIMARIAHLLYWEFAQEFVVKE